MGKKEGKNSSIGAYARLFRIEHAVMLAFAVLLSILLVSRAIYLPLPAIQIILLSLAVPVFIEMGSFALNDYFDVEADRANKREDRPIANGEISKRSALYSAGACYVLGVAASLPLPQYAFFITILFAVLSIAYNFRLKELPLVGNIYIAASMAIPFLFGNFVVTNEPYLPVASIALVAFMGGLGREVIKTTEDMEGDVAHRKARTLPVVIGKENAILFAACCYAAIAPLSFLPFGLGLPPSILSLGLVVVSVLSFSAMAISAIRDHGKENLIALRKSSLLAFAVGLLGYAASLVSF
jgi:geranylgeranylglycerol-phosphate geranylgeranyltransferase